MAELDEVLAAAAQVQSWRSPTCSRREPGWLP